MSMTVAVGMSRPTGERNRWPGGFFGPIGAVPGRSGGVYGLPGDGKGRLGDGKGRLGGFNGRSGGFPGQSRDAPNFRGVFRYTLDKLFRLSIITVMTTIEGDKLRGHLEIMVLSALERGEAHGMEILRRLEHAGCGLLRLKEGSLYPALYRLEAAGKVKALRELSGEGRRGAPRRIYKLTEKGKRELAKGREDWAVFARTMEAVVGGFA